MPCMVPVATYWAGEEKKRRSKVPSRRRTCKELGASKISGAALERDLNHSKSSLEMIMTKASFS